MITVDQIEYLKNKANITYNEAKTLLEKYDGDVIKALCELEERDKLYKTNKEGKRDKAKEEKTFFDHLKDLFRKGYQNRLIVKRNQDVIANFSVNFTLIVILFAPHLSIFSLVLILILGYRIRFKKEGNRTNFEVNEFVNQATQTVKRTVKNIMDEDEITETVKEETVDGYNEVNIE